MHPFSVRLHSDIIHTVLIILLVKYASITFYVVCMCKYLSITSLSLHVYVHVCLPLSRLRALDPPIPLGRVGVPDQLEVAKRFGIGGYPLLIVFRYGKRYNYTGAREEEGEWVMVVNEILIQNCVMSCVNQ